MNVDKVVVDYWFFGSCMLFGRACKTAIVRRITKSYYGDNSPMVKLVTREDERRESKRENLGSDY